MHNNLRLPEPTLVMQQKCFRMRENPVRYLHSQTITACKYRTAQGQKEIMAKGLASRNGNRLSISGEIRTRNTSFIILFKIIIKLR